MVRPVVGLELVINTKEGIDKDGGMVGAAYIDDISIATMGSIDNHHPQVSRVFQLLIYNNMCVEIAQCIFNSKDVIILRCIISGDGLGMDPRTSKAIVDWPRPLKKKEVQQLL